MKYDPQILEGKYRPEPADDWLVNSVSLTPEDVLRQYWPTPVHVVTWHNKRVLPPAKLEHTLLATANQASVRYLTEKK